MVQPDASRFRSRPAVPIWHQGTFWWSFDNKTRTDTAQVGDYDVCWDSVGYRHQDNEFLAMQRCYLPPLLDGVQFDTDGTTKLRELVGYPPGFFQVGFDPAILDGNLPVDDLAALAPRMAAAMNPNRPHVNMATFLGELRDLPDQLAAMPRTLWDLGKNLNRLQGLRRGAARAASDMAKSTLGLVDNLASANLQWKFGWAPLISELRKQLQFQAEFQRRLNWLKKLQEGKTIQRSVKLPDWSGHTFGDPFWAETWAASVKMQYYDARTKRAWVSSRWGAKFPTVTVAGDDAALRRKAWRLVTGMTPQSQMEAVWELIPWSWLIDWFADVGTLLAVTNNSLLLELESLCYMRHITLVREFRVLAKSDWCTVHPDGRFQKSAKWRKPIKDLVAENVLPLPNLPVLTSGQMSILASLFWGSRAIRGGVGNDGVFRITS